MEIRITGNNSGREYSTTSGEWINEPITTTVTVTDKTSNDIYSGIDMDTFINSNIEGASLSAKNENATHTYTLVDANRKEDDTYTICDKVGNCTSQTVKIRVDTIYPTCKSRGGDPNWRSTNLTIYGDCVDQGDPANYSGCRKDTYNNKYSNEITITNGTAGQACDNAGNCVMCSEDQEVHIDKTKPICTLNAPSGEKVAGQPITISASCQEQNVGLIDSVEWTPENNSFAKELNQQSYTLTSATKVPDTYVFTCYNKANLSCSVTTSVKESTCTIHKVYSTGNSCGKGLDCSKCASCSKGTPTNEKTRRKTTNNCYTTFDCEGDEKITSGNKCGYETEAAQGGGAPGGGGSGRNRN